MSTVSSVHTTRRSREEDASVVAPERGRVDSPRRRSTPTSRSPCAAAASSPSADGVDWIVIVRDPCASGRVIRVDGMPGWELIAKHQGPCKPHPNCYARHAPRYLRASLGNPRRLPQRWRPPPGYGHIFCPGRARVARREKNLAGGGKKDINTGPRRHPFSFKIIVRVAPTPMNGH